MQLQTKRCAAAIGLSVALGIGFALSVQEAAADFPDQPITLVVGSAPGSAPDTLARIIAEEMSQILGQPVVTDNRPGAAGAIAAGSVARSDPDGYTMMMMTAVHSISPTTRSDLNYSFVDDFEGVGMVASVPLLFVVNNDLETTDMPGFIERAKQGDIFYSTPGVGTLQHLSTEDFAKKVGIEMTMVPYKGGGNATKAVLANEVQLFFAGIPPALPHVVSGSLTALGISTPERSPVLHDVPTFQELGFEDYNVDNWHALYVPAGTPADVVSKLSDALNATLAKPETAQSFLNVGATPSPSSPEAQTAFGHSEVARWKKIVEDTNIDLGK
ncbi:MAG: tripartite tricarboxylate transporter substrate binding protein [Roseibium sp.]|uniref:Bug family tripartite tricarboxylate transporter substrate binding protein n=1 Tax=Roseibium sp. TaxID=1936156 RepID=UPI002632E8AA|nr:tripartite tricarboxylate transporter substrate-binding protein [Roseibium sp.]MCV0424172.1 tripartite tricarboxylate transporter substrate binding protein [Roseibium sp.]